MQTIEVLLQKSYISNFFNVKKKYEKLFGNNKGEIKYYLASSSIQHKARIDRTSNMSGAPRIHCGSSYNKWINENFKVGDILKVDIYSKNKIKLYK